MVRGAFRLAAGVGLLSVLFVTTAFSPLAHAQKGASPGSGPLAGPPAGPGDIGGDPGVIPIDDGNIPPSGGGRLVLGSPTTPAQIAGVVHHRLSGARVPFPVVAPPGATVASARQLGLVQAPGAPIVMIGLNRIVVAFHNNTDMPQAVAFLRQQGLMGDVRAIPGLRSVYTVETPTALGAFQTADTLANHAALRYAHTDTVSLIATQGVAPVLLLEQDGNPIANGGMFDFGDTDQGTPVVVEFTVTNTGGSDLLLDGPTLPNGFSIGDPLPLVVAAGATSTFSISLDADAAGAPMGDVVILNNTAVNPFTFSIEGGVNAPVGPAELRVTVGGVTLDNGDTVDFGSTTQDTPVTRTFTLINDGGDPLTIGTIAVPSGFEITQQPTSPINAGASSTLTVDLLAEADGTFTGALTFLTNDNNNNPFAVTISGVVTTVSGEGIDDPLFPNQWHLTNTGQGMGTPLVDIGAEPAWELTLGEGAIVAIMDDGTQPDHPDYAANVLTCDNCINFFDIALTPNRGDGSHGTAVAGLVAAIANATGVRGVAPEAQIIPTSFFNDNGDSMADTEIAANWAATAEADAVIHTNSWGFVIGTLLPDVMRDAIIELNANARDGRGMLFLFATANAGLPTIYGSALASMEETAGVGGVDNRGNRARFSGVAGSNYGLGTDFVGPTNGGSRGITTTDVTGEGGYNSAASADGGDFTATFGGTSAATPIVAGVAALAASQNPALHADQIRRILQHTANQNITRTALLTFENTNFGGVSGISESFGFGLASAEAAVLAAQRSLVESNLTWPAPVRDLTVTQSLNSTTIEWTNPPSGAKGEYTGALLVRSTNSNLWRPVDGVEYEAGQIPSFGVEILASGNIDSYTDPDITRTDGALYSVFVFNTVRRYSFGASSEAVRIEPTSVLFDNFESNRGWQVSGDWERGAPFQDFMFFDFLDSEGNAVEIVTATPPRIRGFNAPRSGDNVFGTNLLGNYAAGVQHVLFSPVFDLRNTNSQTVSMTFWEVLDIASTGGDRVIIDIVSTSLDNPVVIRNLRDETPANIYQWTPRFYDLTPELGQEFRIRFTLSADFAPLGRPGTFQGWYMDDFRLGATGGTTPPISGGSRMPGLVRLPPPGGFIFGMQSVPISASPDINGDSRVDQLDVHEVITRFGATRDSEKYYANADLNDDGVIDLMDLLVVVVVANDPSAYSPDESPREARTIDGSDTYFPPERRGAWLHELLNR